jgi:DNA-binding response OmpR family regulator
VNPPSRSAAPVILVLEDEPFILRSLGFVLRQAGFAVLEAGDSAEAARVVTREKPEIVVVDVALLRRQGDAALADLRRRGSLTGCHVILLTEKDEPDERELGARIGAEEFVAKPFAPSLVARRARELLGLGTSR